ncbi:uncharacterized protein LOC110697139 isoform X2 [Chenopodium quinoa]|uniref:uncharacterized protein LOC110697139 isoform X2 n=1 Tax=Chenopodium quinoa TaxID=63459 RepID=UPI000B773073|nr:uncharacterized protein LOC110697139 isoform X2 [Chenopodium quinoa]
MGREWYLNWGTKSSSKKGKTSSGGGDGGGHGNGRNGGGSRGVERKPTTPPTATVAAAAAASSGGCMNAVLHLFDFQHFQLCLHPQDASFLPDDPTPLKGVEAPRNSLESITEEDKDDHLHISKGIKKKTNRRDTALKLVQVPRGKIEDLSSESSCSPASARTPTLVARLMGLDILPESNTTTPRSSHSQTFSPHIRSSTPPISTQTRKSCSACSIPGTRTSYIDNGPGPRSSPETPRSLQSTRRRSMDVVDHHRLSLQINKENNIQREMELSRPSCSAITTKRRDGKNYDAEEVAKSPSYYARQIMKQVKETVSRRVGVDITNTIGREHRRDEHLLSSSTIKPKKSKKDQSSFPHLSSSSPRYKTYSDENHKHTSSKNSEQLPPAVTEVPPKTVTVQAKPVESEDESLKKPVHPITTTTTTTATTATTPSKKPLKSYNSIRNKKEEQFVHPSTMTTTTTSKKCKKNMLSSDLLHGTVPSLVPLKKDSSPVPSPTKLLDNQGISSEAQLSKRLISTTTSTTTTRLSRYPRQRIDEKRQEEATHAPADRWRSGRKDAGTGTGTSVMEFQYISRILKCTGIDRDTPVSFTRWYLPSHPLDPSIYHTLEATHYITTSDRFCEQLNLSVNRKLIFHLVDEMLADMLKPYVKLKNHYHRRRYPNNHRDTQMNGFQLVKTLCSKIRSFPIADCQTLQDIDALVEKDMPRIGATSDMIVYHDEGEGDDIVTEIERYIMDSLVQEMCYIG